MFANTVFATGECLYFICQDTYNMWGSTQCQSNKVIRVFYYLTHPQIRSLPVPNNHFSLDAGSLSFIIGNFCLCVLYHFQYGNNFFFHVNYASVFI